MRGHVVALGVVVSLSGGCSSEPPRESFDAGAVVAPSKPESVVARLRRTPIVGELLAARGATQWSAGGALELPRDGSGPVRVRFGGGRALTLDLPHTQSAHVEDDVLVRPGATVDVALFATRGAVEELRVVHAPTAAPYELHLGLEGGLEVALAGDHVEVRDGQRVVARSSKVTAIDATGARFVLSLALSPEPSGARVTAVLPEGLTYPVVVDPLWTADTSMAQAHGSWVQLTTGEILAVGGFSDNGLVELRSSSGTWTTTGRLVTGRDRPGLVALPSGDALAVNGISVSTAERFSYATKTWSTVPSPPADFTTVNGVWLPSISRALFAGQSAVLFDPATNTWSAATALAQNHQSGGRTVLLAGGKALVVGGGFPTLTTVAELFDPATKTWATTGSMVEARGQMGLTALPDGRALVTGGYDTTAFNSTSRSTVELYDPATGKFTLGPSMFERRGEHGAVLLGTGRLLVFGGGDGTSRTNLTEIFDPLEGSWVRSDSMVFGCKAMGAFHVGGATSTAVLSVGGVNVGGLTAGVQAWEASANGVACTGPGQCASGKCVDGVCCNTACTEQCKACNTASAKGTCTNVTTPVAPRPACGPSYACVAGACATSCTGDGATECAASAYCAAGKCAPKKPLGEVCATTAECSSGRCVDGVCCDSPCTEQCLACDVPGKLGTCSPVSLGVPHGTRPSCAPYACLDGKCATSCATLGACATGYYCAAGTSCVAARKDGEACATDDVCTSKHCVDGYCCGSACDGQCVACDVAGKLGTCTGVDGVPHGKRASCAPYACSATTAGGGCVGACTKDSECDAASTCDATKCVPRKDLGVACTASTQCKSGTCVDGVCCNRACDGQCEACDVAGSVGTCGPVNGEPHGARTKCSDGAGEVCRARACDGAKDPTRCTGFAKGTTDACKAAVCEADRFTPSSTCSGAGACVDKDTISCRPFACDASGCLTSCTVDTQCSSGFFCRAGACVPREGLNVCTTDKLGSVSPDGRRTDCNPYLCDDGTAPATAGRCRKSCASSAECASGFACADGACVPATSEVATDGGCSPSRAQGKGGFAPAILLASALATRRRRTLAAASLTGLLGCSSSAPEPAVDAGVTPATEAKHEPASALATLQEAGVRLHPTRVIENATSLTLVGRRTSLWRRAGAELQIEAPHRADGPTRLRAGGHELTLREDAAPAKATIVDGGVVFEGGAAGDLALTAKDDQFESFRVLRGGTADPVLRLHLGSTLRHVRAIDTRLEVLDSEGGVAFATAPTWARDAHHRTVAVHPVVRRVGLADFEVTLAVDARAELTLPIVVDPLWTIGSAVATARSGPLALLGSKVLSVGGSSGVAQLYDPATAAWASAGTLTATDDLSARVAYDATHALFIGGSGAPKQVQRFDLATSTWSAVGSLSVARNDCALRFATPLAGGKVLVAGGTTSNVTELWNGSSWVEAGTGGKLAVGRGCAAVVTLASGRAMLVGGSNGAGPLRSADVYDPATDTWTKTGDMNVPRWFHTATALPDGGVMAVGGQGGPGNPEVWSPTTGTWTVVAKAAYTRGDGTSAVTLPGGRVLTFGGDGTSPSLAEVWDPATNTWSPSGSLSSGRKNAGAVYVPAPYDQVVVVGGTSIGGDEKIVEIFEQFANGAACSSAGECKSGSCIDGVCCDTACKEQCKACDLPGKVGTCSAVDKLPSRGARPTCAPFVCVAGVCPTSCASDGECDPSRYCGGGACLAKKTGAAACARAAECATGFCVDAVCCNVACGGACEACDLTGTVGTCFPLASGAPRGTHTSCAPFLCKGGACATTCATSAECTAGNGCVGGKCVPKGDLGATCTSTDGCLSGQCVDGVCCDTACGEQCKACNEVGTVGKCTAVSGAPRGARASCAPYLCGAGACATTCKADGDCATGNLCEGGACVKARAPGEACTKDAACASGFCTDGVCCDARCDGACEACDATGKAGTCTPVSGAPHGKRAACDDGGGDVCKARLCDGVDRKSCAAFVAGTTVSCAGSVCRTTGYRGQAFCDGKGTCAAPLETSCVPFACDPKGCLTKCTDDAQCAPSFRCVSGNCAAVGDVCSADLAKVLKKGGGEEACAPYLCRGGACSKECATSDDCDLSHRCVDRVCAALEQPAPAEGDGGCGCAVPGTRNRGSTAALALMVLLAGRLRRYHRRR